MYPFSEEEKRQIIARGSDVKQINNQIQHFVNGFPFLDIDRAATVGDGIIQFSATELSGYIKKFEELSKEKKLLKFVPASGAATRMFKDLFAFVESGEANAASDKFLYELQNFAFYDQLKDQLGDDATESMVVSKLLDTDGLGYGSLPKGLLAFHQYDGASRTPLEEHLVEGAAYAKGAGDVVNLHFTVSPEHQTKFEAVVSKVQTDYEERLAVKYNISFSQQKSSTDTIAVDLENNPFREGANILFRPAGHGALLENLNDLEADVIFVKNIDNVLPDRLKGDTINYKKALAGLLLELQEEIFEHLIKLNAGRGMEEASRFCQEKLGVEILPDVELLKSFLNRPIRVCGMVKNTGEPGGGPFWVRSGSETSLQIAETAQINLADANQSEMLKSSSHFNPVDLVCGTKDFKGSRFDLLEFRDDNTGFITQKSRNGRDVKAQELPGLWNGAMADWITVFVEVPISTFSPVKTIIDLLKDSHQSTD